MIILVDMDEVLADFEGGLLARWEELYPSEDLFPHGERRAFYVGAEADREKQHRVNAITHAEGFFESLAVKEGAAEALAAMHDLGHRVYILTSPGVSFPYAASEKYRWVAKHFGTHMLEWLIMTPAKAIVHGDILIDDRPEINFEDQASWEHVLFDRPYNSQVTQKRRLNWQNWQEVLTELS